MTDRQFNVVLAVIVGLPAMMGALLTFVGVLLNIQGHNMALKAAIKADEAKEQMDKLEKSTNGKMDKMLELTARSSKAEGIKEEHDRHTGL